MRNAEVREESLREERKDREGFEDPHQASSYRCNRSRFSDQKPGPRIQKSRQRPVRVTNINVLAARLRLHSAQFGISQRTEKREQPSDHPSEIYKSSRPYRLHHLGWNQKNSAPDDGPDHNGPRMGQPQVARQFRAELAVLCGFVHSLSASSANSAVQAFGFKHSMELSTNR